MKTIAITGAASGGPSPTCPTPSTVAVAVAVALIVTARANVNPSAAATIPPSIVPTTAPPITLVKAPRGTTTSIKSAPITPAESSAAIAITLGATGGHSGPIIEAVTTERAEATAGSIMPLVKRPMKRLAPVIIRAETVVFAAQGLARQAITTSTAPSAAAASTTAVVVLLGRAPGALVHARSLLVGPIALAFGDPDCALANLLAVHAFNACICLGCAQHVCDTKPRQMQASRT